MTFGDHKFKAYNRAALVVAFVGEVRAFLGRRQAGTQFDPRAVDAFLRLEPAQCIFQVEARPALRDADLHAWLDGTYATA